MLNIIYLIITLVSGFICVFLHIGSSNFEIPYFIIPLAYLICLIFVKKYHKYSNTAVLLIIEILMVIRYDIMPLSYYYSGNSLTSLEEEYIFLAVFLMIFEMVCVCISLNYATAKYMDNFAGSREKSFTRGTHITDVGTFLIIFAFIALLASHPQYLTHLFTFSFEDFSAVETESNIDGMYNLLYKTGVIVFGCWIMSILGKRENKTNIQFALCLIVSIIAIWIGSVGTSGLVSRTTFLTNGIIYCLMLLRNFPKERGKIIVTYSVIIFAMLLIGSISRFYSSDSVSYASTQLLSYDTLDSYFGGIRDITVGLKMKYTLSNKIGVSTLFTDVFAGVPYVATRSGMNFNNRIPYYFNQIFWGNAGSTSRICPMICQSAAYFGILLAPILSCVCIILAVKLYISTLRCNNEASFYAFSLAMYYCCAYSMYNVNIIFNGVWNKILPMVLVLVLNRIDLKNGTWIISQVEEEEEEEYSEE